MPKPPTNPHPLYIVRKELGWTQQRLADKCGVAAVTIKKIEGRTLKPSRELLGRITFATGVDPDSLSRKSPTFMRGPYTGKTVKPYMELFDTYSRGDFTEGAGAMFFNKRYDSHLSMLDDLFQSAAKKNALLVLFWSLRNWVAEMIVEFELEKEFLQEKNPSDVDRKSLLSEVKSRLRERKAKR